MFITHTFHAIFAMVIALDLCKPPWQSLTMTQPLHVSSSSDPVLSIPQHIIGPRFVNQDRGVFKRQKDGEYQWLHNCGRICEAEAEVKMLNKSKNSTGRSNRR